MDEVCDVVSGATSNTASQPAGGGGGGSGRIADGGVDEVRNNTGSADAEQMQDKVRRIQFKVGRKSKSRCLAAVASL